MALPKDALAALLAWRGTNEENNVFSFGVVSRESGLERSKVRRIVRYLARKGLLQFCQVSWNDEGPRGAGYMPTTAGYEEIAKWPE